MKVVSAAHKSLIFGVENEILTCVVVVQGGMEYISRKY